MVAIVGRPNVGKSTLFNRIVGAQEAVVDDRPGVTRDRHSLEAEWAGRRFTLVDTGGLVPASKERLARQVNAQIRAAIDEADVCLLVVDGREGVTATDREVADLLRRSGRTTLLAVNKADNRKMAEELVWDFHELGLGEPRPVSGTTGLGTGDLLDAVVDALPRESPAEPEEPDTITVSVIGKPNVGKSSFLNALLGEERFIVSPEAGTTRDAIDTTLEYRDRRFRLVDTAGIRRHSRHEEGLEYYTYLRAVRSLDRAQIAISMLDATQPLSRQDLRILNLAADRRRGIVVCVNKWDLVEKDERTAAGYEAAFRDQARSLAWAPLVTISAKTGQRVRRALEVVETVWEEWNKRVKTSELNEVLERATARVQPPQAKGPGGGRVVRVLYGHQVETAPPLILLYSNLPSAVPEHYRRYLENAIRDAFGFVGVPLRIYYREADPKSRAKAGAASRRSSR